MTNKFSSNQSRILPFCMAVLMCIGLFFAMIYTVKWSKTYIAAAIFDDALFGMCNIGMGHGIFTDIINEILTCRIKRKPF